MSEGAAVVTGYPGGSRSGLVGTPIDVIACSAEVDVGAVSFT